MTKNSFDKPRLRSQLALTLALVVNTFGVSSAGAQESAADVGETDTASHSPALPRVISHGNVSESYVVPPLDPGMTSNTLTLTSGWTISTQSEGLIIGGAGQVSDLSGARLDLVESPEMVIIDTGGRSATFAVRSRNSSVWSDWESVETDTEDTPDAAGLTGDLGSEGSASQEGAASSNASAIGPIWIGTDSEAFEIVQLEGDLTSVRVETLEAQDGQPAGLLVEGDPEDDGVAGPHVTAALASQPTIQPRSAWATEGWAYSNSGCSSGPSIADNVRAVVVHHTVTTNSYSAGNVDDIIRGIYRTHVKINGWCDVGYNFIVDRFGTIWEARSGGIDRPVIGGHAKGFNTWSAGVALLGQHQAGASPSPASPTQASLNSIAALASWKLGLHGVDPLGTTWMKSRTNATSGLRFANGTWVEIPTVLGHRDLGFTSCPGSYAHSRLPGVRANMIRDTVAPYRFDSYQPALSGPAFLTVDSEGGLRAGAASASPSEVPAVSGPVVAVDAIGGKGFSLLASGLVSGIGGPSAPVGKPAGFEPGVDIVVTPEGTSGYVIGANGGVHPFNGAAELTVAAVAAGSMVAADIESNGFGYLLDNTGGLYAVGGAPGRTLGQQVQAVDIGLLPNGASGWVLDSSGGLHSFGNAPTQVRSSGVWNGVARAIAVDPNGNGGWLLDSEGRLVSFGDVRPAAVLSTTVGTPTAVDVALWWELPTSLADQDDARYAAALTEVFLGRSATLTELDRLVWEADFRGADEVADSLANSDEWAGKIVDDLYISVLGRPPEAGGRAYWVGRLRDGLRTQDLGTLFYSTPEYVRSAGSNEAYVALLYRALLHREPDTKGLHYWVTRLGAGVATPIDISSGFYRSIESRKDRVVRMYQDVLGRGPDDGGLAYWADRIVVEDDIDLARNLALSPEFYGSATK